MHIIIKGNEHDKFGKTRSEQEENMRKEWGQTMTDSQLDKLKYIERKEREFLGKKKGFTELHKVDRIK
ncbi:MAG TPA: hypothetical protein VMW50_10295 [Dehalococcoidia bacterium]|nr:hypothetical protein [Dehalococcoidia bacterium]